MKRPAGRLKPPMKKIEEIPVSERFLGGRVIGLVVMIAVAMAAFSYALIHLLGTEPGWREVELRNDAKTTIGGEFVFQYQLGVSGRNATEEYKQLQQCYTDALDEAYWIFGTDSAGGYANLGDLCARPGEPVSVEPALYEALTLLEQYESRYLYLAPVYQMYRSLFGCDNDSETVHFDPAENEDAADFCRRIAEFAGDPESIRIELLGDYTARLIVSEEYQRFAAENGITQFVEFFWLRNAFVLDYVAERLEENGFYAGTITSFDGFTRTLDQSDTAYSFNLYDRVEETVYLAAEMQYQGAASLVFFRDYPINSLDEINYYVMENGQIRSPFISPQTVLCSSAVHNLAAISTQYGCAEVALQILPIYLAEEFVPERLRETAKQGTDAVWCVDRTIYSTSDTVSFAALFENGTVQYRLNQG